MTRTIKKLLREQYLTPRARIKLIFENNIRLKKDNKGILGDEEYKRLFTFFYNSEKEDFKNYVELYNQHLSTNARWLNVGYYFYQMFYLLMYILRTPEGEFKKDRTIRQVLDRTKDRTKDKGQIKYSDREGTITFILNDLKHAILDLKRGTIVAQLLGKSLKIDNLDFEENRLTQEVIKDFIGLKDLNILEDKWKVVIDEHLKDLEKIELLKYSPYFKSRLEAYNGYLSEKDKVGIFFND